MDRIGLFKTMDISAAGLSLQRMKLDVVAENLANAETTRTENGEPYRRKTVTVKTVKDTRRAASAGMGRFSELLTEHVMPALSAPPAEVPEGAVGTDEKTPFTLRYDPGHPDADENGVVRLPNVNIIDEMVDMITATRAYEANVTAIQAAKDMFMKALEI